MEIEPEVAACMNDMLDIVVNKEERRLKKNKKQSEYYQKNKEKKRLYDIQYRQTPEGKKSQRIAQWKHNGVICDNWDAMYNHYTKTSYCNFCKVELSTDKERSSTTKCLDHDHNITDRPNFRNILCNSCNVQRK